MKEIIVSSPNIRLRVKRLLIVDDSAVFVRVVSRFIQNYPDLELVGIAESGLAGISLAQELQPDIILLDIGLPDGSGLELIPDFKKALPRTGIIVLTLHNEKTIHQEALSAGAEDFVTKSSLTNALLPTIYRVYQAITSKPDNF